MLYLLTAIYAPFTLIYMPNTLFVRGNATATANNIAAHETLFRLGIAIDLFGAVIWISVIVALYRLHKGVE
jgi:hypothetical protein